MLIAFQSLNKLFCLNIDARIDWKLWMNDSHLRTTITPTLSFKAKFTTSFNSFDESSSDSIIMKINISHKVNRNIQHNKNEREFSHLNNWDDIISGSSRNNFDYWPIPDAVAVTIDHEEFVPRECIQTIIIKTKPLEYLNEEYLRSIKDKTISPLIDSIDRHFNLNILQKINLKISMKPTWDENRRFGRHGEEFILDQRKYEDWENNKANSKVRLIHVDGCFLNNWKDKTHNFHLSHLKISIRIF